MLRFLLFVAGSVFLSACASAPKEIPPDAIIVNRLNTPIKGVYFRPCEPQSGNWALLENSFLPHGGVLKLALPEDCVDLQARDAKGAVLGTQSSIKRQLPFRWQLY